MRQESVAILMPPQASLFELATPVGVWGSGRAEVAGKSPFDLVVCTPTPDEATNTTAGLSITGCKELSAARDAELVVVPTWPARELHGPDGSLDSVTVAALRRGCDEIVAFIIEAHSRGATIVGLCLGAFAVAESGLLDSREAVTHWALRDLFCQLFPEVNYNGDPLYVDHGSIVTSAGSAAALDCCLHLVRRRHGATVATQVARSMVTPPHREGNQTQFVPPRDEIDDAGLSTALSLALAYATDHLTEITTMTQLASGAGMSRRSLERAFLSELAVTPAAWLLGQRILRARLILETTNMSIEQVAAEAGLGSAASLQRYFRERMATTPRAYRAAFGTT